MTFSVVKPNLCIKITECSKRRTKIEKNFNYFIEHSKNFKSISKSKIKLWLWKSKHKKQKIAFVDVCVRRKIDMNQVNFAFS